MYQPTNERNDYANSEQKMAYRDHDFALAAQWEALSDADRDRLDLNITGIDVTNGPTIGQELDNRLRAHPRVFTGVGKVTLKAEILSKTNPHKTKIGSRATQILLIETAIRGLPVILENDRGVPGRKNKYADQMVKAIREWADRMTRFGNEQDPLKLRPGVNPATVPAMKPRLVWEYGAGMSRFTAGSNHHTSDLDTLLNDATFTDILYLDLSGDFVINDILQNLYDQLKRNNVAPGLQQGLQNVLKLYKSFSALGGIADKAAHLNDPTLASIDRVGAEAIAEQYFTGLADFSNRVQEAFNDPNTRETFQRLMAEHGQQGNNWLYLMRAHADRLMFGTGALAVATQAHGAAAYAMNTRAMYPIFDILDEAERHADDIPDPRASPKRSAGPTTRKSSTTQTSSAAATPGRTTSPPKGRPNTPPRSGPSSTPPTRAIRCSRRRLRRRNNPIRRCRPGPVPDQLPIRLRRAVSQSACRPGCPSPRSCRRRSPTPNSACAGRLRTWAPRTRPRINAMFWMRGPSTSMRSPRTCVQMATVPIQARTPSWRQYFVDTLAAFAANTVGFTVPTALAQSTKNPQAATRIFSGAVAALGVAHTRAVLVHQAANRYWVGRDEHAVALVVW